MISWAWLILAYVFGGLVGGPMGIFLMALCVSNATSRDKERIIGLRLTLERLVRIVGKVPMPLGQHDAMEKALKEAWAALKQ